MSMLYYGTPEKFPDVKMIFSHAGGAMPYLAGRTAVLSQRNKDFKLSGDKLMPAMRNFFYDVTQSLSAPTFAALARWCRRSNCCSARTARSPRSHRCAPCSASWSGLRCRPANEPSWSAATLWRCFHGLPEQTARAAGGSLAKSAD